MTDVQELESGLAQHYGTVGYTRFNPILFPKVLLTDGALYLANEAQCYWMMDIIASVLNNDNIKNREFVVAKIKVNTDNSAVVTIEDGNDKILYEQSVGMTDFPLKEFTLFIGQGEEGHKIIMIPSEY